jgi:hypothetical protein
LGPPSTKALKCNKEQLLPMGYGPISCVFSLHRPRQPRPPTVRRSLPPRPDSRGLGSAQGIKVCGRGRWIIAWGR